MVARDTQKRAHLPDTRYRTAHGISRLTAVFLRSQPPGQKRVETAVFAVQLYDISDGILKKQNLGVLQALIMAGKDRPFHHNGAKKSPFSVISSSFLLVVFFL